MGWGRAVSNTHLAIWSLVDDVDVTLTGPTIGQDRTEAARDMQVLKPGQGCQLQQAKLCDAAGADDLQGGQVLQRGQHRRICVPDATDAHSLQAKQLLQGCPLYAS